MPIRSEVIGEILACWVGDGGIYKAPEPLYKN
jgi:hypothetical protein